MDNNEWEYQLHNLSSLTLLNLEVGQTDSFKVGVLGTNGQAAYSAVITKMVYSF